MLSQPLAQEIARETSEIIGFNVVVTDQDGIIIGSGDPTRVGTFHEASMDVIRTLAPATHGAEQAGRLTGVKPGVTLPLLLDGDVMGTVGITGAPRTVRRFGLMVRRQTEILLREAQVLRSQMVREKAVADLLRDLVHYDPDVVEAEVLVTAARELGFDLTSTRVAAVVEAEQPSDCPHSEVVRLLRTVFRDSQDVVGATGHARFVVLHRIPRNTPAQDTAAAALDLGARARKALHAHYGVDARIGIGDPASSVAGIHESCQGALTAVRLGSGLPSRVTARLHQGPDGRVHHISHFRLYELLSAAGHRARDTLLATVAGPLRRQDDWPALRETLIAWCETGFRLVQAAEALRIHRNTLVYRLEKIARITGRPTRHHQYYLALYLACLIDEMAPPADQG
ncbi:helix-turn-helix domain-containing protein [Streptomyces oryzae]|uniref:Helix-turn-helix domain-containing protein n=1 Tax=Streptomyces oryzae TaxID=1434886 RepID=A0ABS3X6Z0_9ACTN|nr:sugar diacid recognition domain-containing protein [Streptomyces oryzae]MBO8191094.1 helix-turn-helix domain-containing protein [Streptomyces oryzae]